MHDGTHSSLGLCYNDTVESGYIPSSNLLRFNLHLQSRSHKFSPSLGTERFGSLDWCAHSTVDDELWQDTDGSRNAKEDRVVACLSQSVVLQ